MAYFWWGIAKILYFMGLNFENLYGRNTIGFTAYLSSQSRSLTAVVQVRLK
jgi:hypothetical protein